MNITKDDVAETITANWVNTANPWAENEVASTFATETEAITIAWQSKDSSLVSVIAITDLTKVGREIVANTFSPFETWIVIAAVYLSITFTMSYIGHRIEKRMAAKGGMS